MPRLAARVIRDGVAEGGEDRDELVDLGRVEQVNLVGQGHDYWWLISSGRSRYGTG